MFVIIFIVEVFLSHQDGYRSGDESRAIATFLKIPDKYVRVGAHIISFMLLMFIGLMACYPKYTILIIIGILLWAVLDEATKPLLHNFRHMSIMDIGFNILGSGIGFIVWIIIRI